MANNSMDTYIDNLETGDEIEMEVGICTILYKDSQGCTVLDDQGESRLYGWGEIAEAKEIQESIDKESEETNRGIDFEKSL